MRVLGVVRWTNFDKGGNPIAAVHPMFEVQKSDWREINATEEFPTQSQVFWFQSQNAAKDMLVFFRTEPNPGQKDEFRVVDAKPALEILDVRHLGEATQVRAALFEGHYSDQMSGGRKLLWCLPNLLVGPVDISIDVNGAAKLTGSNLARVATFAAGDPRRVWDGSRERLLRQDENPPNGYVDWDIDEVVLKRAIEVAARIARHAGKEIGQTKRQIEEAAKVLTEQGVSADSQLELYRLERTLGMCSNASLLAKIAPAVVDTLRGHPKIADELLQLETKVRTEVEQRVRADLKQSLTSEQKALAEVKSDREQLLAQLAIDRQALREATDGLARIREESDSVVREIEGSVADRIRSAVDRPADFLAEVSILRPFLTHVPQTCHGGSVEQSSSPVHKWHSQKAELIKDSLQLKRSLTNAARERGVKPSYMLELHAAFNAGLTPVMLGANSTASLAAYAYAVCSNRLAVHCVSPRIIDLHDLIAPTSDLVSDSYSSTSIFATASAALDFDGLSIILLEGANRSPLESSLVPLLEMRDVGTQNMCSPFGNSLSQVPGLRIAATFVLGQTTVPVTPQLWSHAVAFQVTPISPVQCGSECGHLPLSSDLLARGDTPVEEVEHLIDIWPDCIELRSAMERFGASLSAFYSDRNRIRTAILEGLVLPFVVTSLSEEEHEEIVRRFSLALDSDLTILAKQLRRRLR